jgi:predicted Zn-dependent protease
LRFAKGILEIVEILMFGKLGLLTLGFGLCLSVGCATNPITGKEELMLIPVDQDVEIGRKYAPEIEKELGGKIENESLQNYIDSVGQKVARISHRPDWEYQFAALNDDSVNAFALPGGYIFITKGMLEKLQTEAQLASILAHETVHIVARDTSNVMSNQIGIGLLLSAVTSEETSEGVLTAVNLTRQIIGLRYSRKDEREADLGGMRYMVAAGYNPNGMVETMQMLQEQQKARSIEFLSSHPSPENRVGYLAKEIQMKYHNLAELKIAGEDYRKAVLGELQPD